MTPGDTVRDPFAATGLPSSITLAALLVVQVNIADCPTWIEAALAARFAVGIGTGGGGGGGGAVTVTIAVETLVPAVLVALSV